MRQCGLRYHERAISVPTVELEYQGRRKGKTRKIGAVESSGTLGLLYRRYPICPVTNSSVWAMRRKEGSTRLPITMKSIPPRFMTAQEEVFRRHRTAGGGLTRYTLVPKEW